jgi:hypothetical protein
VAAEQTRVERWLVDVMDGVRVCLADALEHSRDGAPCFIALYSGAQVAADHCGCGADGCGMAWVRLARAFPSSNFPAPDVTINVSSPIAAMLEVGAMRCVPVGKGPAGPTAADQINATLSQVSDMEQIRKALGCCDVLEDRDTSLGTYSPMGSGGCAGGAWSIAVRLRPSGGRQR